MVLKACPYEAVATNPTPIVKKSFFKKVIDKAVSVYENVIVNATAYVASAFLIGTAFA
ncbi:hypothetical protein D3C85_1743430 [compost metagenome]